MSEVLLQTKLYRPLLRPSLVSRPHLVIKLNAGLGEGETGFAGKVSLVSAPPGFGKTTLVLEWLDQLPEEYGTAWLSLESGDDDPNRFFAYLIGALQTIEPDIGQALSSASQFPPPESVAEMLVHELTAVSRPLILVLDDYHLVTNPAINRAMAFLFDHTPPNIHLVVVGRADPPFSLSRLRIRRQLTEIRAHDLRFTLSEATDFLNLTMGLSLTPDEVALLESRTEGWVAGLQLAAHSLQLGQDKAVFLAAFAGDDRYVADYLVEEVLSHQPEAVQSFLLQTSILDRLNSRLCNALLERQDSQATLELLEQSNLFIIPLDNRRQWYRYHHLFAELLRERLEASPREWTRLHQRASRWFAENKLIPEAVEHALSATDYERTVVLILESAAEMFGSSRLLTLLRWWQRIPEEIASQNLQLCMMVAWAWLATGYGQESEQCLQAVEHALGKSVTDLMTDIDSLEPDIRNGLIEVATARISNQAVFQADVSETLTICQRILPYLVEEEQPHLFNPLIDLRPAVLFNMGQAYQALGRLDEATTAFEETITLGKTLGNVHLLALATGHMAEVQTIQGQLHQAADTCRQGVELVGTLAGQISPLSGLLHVRLGQMAYEWNELEAAVQHLTDGIEVAKQWRNREALLPGYLGLVRVYRALGQDQDALDAERAFDELIIGEPVPADSVAKAWLYVEQGELEEAGRWLEGADLRPDEQPLREAEAIILVRIRLLQGELEEASQWLETLLDSAESGERWGRVFELLVLQAMILDAQEDREAAIKSLSRALKMAESQGYIRTFVDGGRPVRQLLREAARGGAAPDYVNKLLTAFATDERMRRETGKEVPPSLPSPGYSLMDPLSEREVEVLQLIAEGLSNKEIAARLYLAPGTVKVHAHNIYSKLGVNGRTQAVARARALNLLPQNP